ncbi:MAG: hypothetical protein A2042_03675 [Candidatus Schekmanbacteria bacterium GWA2_38_11]|uniref:PTS EIIA type-2 domain-containing protein n=1 Tax=Candidatus Schekmanbacteria bacterium GWA2_38_11 TaxID=1817876 RepID=A0A1F7RL77_9BACT|nr:MAG: hypothetical protein A2042_03675 [Candidatus Schekmanbacteria bacterium GWA2_38_11]
MFSQFLFEDQVYLDLKAKNSFGCFLEMLRCLEDSKIIKDKAPILTALMTREELEPTSVGCNIAFPHARTFQLEKPILIIGRSKEGIDFYSRDGKKINFVFMLLFPRKFNELYLELVGEIMRFLSNSALLDCLQKINTPEELITLIKEIEKNMEKGFLN